MKHATSLLLAAGLAAAQQSQIVSVLMPFADDQGVVASIISAGPTATDYFLTCPTGTPSEECGMGEGVKLLYGPETITYAMTFESSSMSAACVLDPAKDLASCSGVMVSGTSTDQYTESAIDYSAYIRPITVTAGLDKIAATTTGAGATSSSTGGAMPRVTQNAVVIGAAAVVVGGAALLI